LAYTALLLTVLLYSNDYFFVYLQNNLMTHICEFYFNIFTGNGYWLYSALMDIHYRVNPSCWGCISITTHFYFIPLWNVYTLFLHTNPCLFLEAPTQQRVSQECISNFALCSIWELHVVQFLFPHLTIYLSVDLVTYWNYSKTISLLICHFDGESIYYGINNMSPVTIWDFISMPQVLIPFQYQILGDKA